MESFLHIDVSKYETKKDLIKVKFQNEDFFQIDFSKLFKVSEYLREKYKYSEAMNIIQKEISSINKDVSDESIKYFIDLIENEKVDIPYERYRDVYTLSEYFNIQKNLRELDNLRENKLYQDINFTIQLLIDSERSESEIGRKLTIKIEKFLSSQINECLKNNKFKILSNSTISRIIEQNQKSVNNELLFEFIIESALTRFILIKFVSLDKLREDQIDEMIKFIEEQEEETQKKLLDYIPFNISLIKMMKNKYDQLLKEMKEKLEKRTALHKETKEKLDKETTSHKETKEKLEKEITSHKETKEKLENETTSHKETKKKLESEATSHKETKEKLEKEITSHKETKEKLAKESTSHKETKEKLEKEITSHEETKKKLEGEIERLKNMINIEKEENSILETYLIEYEDKKKKDETPNEERKYSIIKLGTNQVNEQLEKSKRNIKETKDSINHTQSIFVGGNDTYNQLGEKPNNKAKYGDHPIINPPVKLNFDPYSYLSYSVYCGRSVHVMSDGSLKAIGNNEDGRITSCLPKTRIDHFIDFCIKDDSDQQLNPVSAICYSYGTLFMFSKMNGNGRQLVLCDKDINGSDPVFLDIGDHDPVALFGGNSHSAAICSNGEIIFINRNLVKKSPKSRIASVSLPRNVKASSVACCTDSVVVLSTNNQVFSSPVDENSPLRFSRVLELMGKEIICVSGNFNHVLAVSKEGRVFGRGSNQFGKLGLEGRIETLSSFIEISSLAKYEIRAAYAGCFHSLFETREGKIISCGHNNFGELLLNSGPSEYVCSPSETMITDGATFCIAGADSSVVFTGDILPRNMPNTRVLNFEKDK